MSDADEWTIMSHESHGQCWCAVGVHCGGTRDCQNTEDHEIGRHECTFADVTVRHFACGSHINRVLTDADWLLDTLCIYDLTYPPERS